MNAPAAALRRPAFGRVLEALLERLAPRRLGHGTLHRVAPGCALALGDGAGELRVVRGRAWLTCHGDAQDHFVDAGAWVHLRAGHGAVVEPIAARRALVVQWTPLGAA